MNIENYINLAKSKNNISSNNKLAATLGLTGTSIHWISKKKSIPTDHTMLKLADLAGINKYQALIDLNIWRNENNLPVKQAWEEFKNLTKYKE